MVADAHGGEVRARQQREDDVRRGEDRADQHDGDEITDGVEALHERAAEDLGKRDRHRADELGAVRLEVLGVRRIEVRLHQTTRHVRLLREGEVGGPAQDADGGEALDDVQREREHAEDRRERARLRVAEQVADPLHIARRRIEVGRTQHLQERHQRDERQRLEDGKEHHRRGCERKATLRRSIEEREKQLVELHHRCGHGIGRRHSTGGDPHGWQPVRWGEWKR